MNKDSKRPSFSVIIGCYNHSPFIRETVNSVLSQSYPPREVIVVDDVSPDDSVSVLKAFGDSITLLALEKNGGGSAARNAGASLASGDYLVFLDGDDALTPWALEVYARLVELKSPMIMLASMFFFGGPTVQSSEIFWKGPQPIKDYDGFSEDISFLDYGVLANKDHTFRSSGTSMIMERIAFWRVGGWTAEIFPGEDTDLLLRMLYEPPALHILSPPTAYCRIHPSNTMKQVGRFLRGLNIVIRQAKSGCYSKTLRQRIEAYAFMGGEVWFWVKRATSTGEFGLAGKLVLDGAPMIILAVFRRIAERIGNRRTPEVLPPLRSGARMESDQATLGYAPSTTAASISG